MYAYVDGILEYVEPEVLVVDVNGLGINVHVYSSDALALPPVGERIRIYTYTSVAEDKFMLYGFMTREEINLFKMLISVTGVGPKSAQAMLAVLGVEEIEVAIATEDVKTISKTPGIGAKVAGRLINDLKDKVKPEFLVVSKGASKDALSKAGATKETFTATEEECITALVNLGYARQNAQKSVTMVEGRENLSTEELLPLALKNVMFL